MAAKNKKGTKRSVKTKVAKPKVKEQKKPTYSLVTSKPVGQRGTRLTSEALLKLYHLSCERKGSIILFSSLSKFKSNTINIYIRDDVDMKD